MSEAAGVPVERVQLGVRLEKRMVKVLKALAEYGDMTLTELLEDIVLHAFEGHSTFSDPDVQERVRQFKHLYDMDYDVHASYRFQERGSSQA
ncbi:MAG: hypothetical protein ACK46X_10035 [Candidatus Sericytochromatia bacterium]